MVLRTRTTLTMTLRALTTLATIRTTLTTVTALSALRTLAALTTGGTLYVTFWLLNQHAVGELVLTRLRVNLKELHLDLVSLLDTCFLDSLETLPVNLTDMKQTVLARHNLYEAAVRHNRADGTLVDLTHLRDGYDSLDLGNSSVNAGLIGSADLYVTHTVGFVDGDGGTGILLHLLDDLSARANDGTDKQYGEPEVSSLHEALRWCR